MANFKFSALDNVGQNVRGQVEARDENSAFSALIARGLSPISVQERGTGTGLSRLKRIRPKDLAMMTRQIAVLLSAGISLTETMSSLVIPPCLVGTSRTRAFGPSGGGTFFQVPGARVSNPPALRTPNGRIG